MRRTLPIFVLVSACISMEYGCTGTADTIAPPPVDPCAGVTCTGHGTCATTSADLPICACDQDYHAQGLDCVADPVGTAPVVTLAANPTTVDSGGTSTLTWSATNATSCTASGAWSGSRAVSGSEESSAIAVDASFTLTCAGPGGSTTQTALVAVRISGAGGENVLFRITHQATTAGGTTYPVEYGADLASSADLSVITSRMGAEDGINIWSWSHETVGGYGGRNFMRFYRWDTVDGDPDAGFFFSPVTLLSPATLASLAPGPFFMRYRMKVTE
ncbi:MAG: hypothetical protein AAB426_03155, partial [Myxococcota bacterium]